MIEFGLYKRDTVCTVLSLCTIQQGDHQPQVATEHLCVDGLNPVVSRCKTQNRFKILIKEHKISQE